MPKRSDALPMLEEQATYHGVLGALANHKDPVLQADDADG